MLLSKTTICVSIANWLFTLKQCIWQEAAKAFPWARRLCEQQLHSRPALQWITRLTTSQWIHQHYWVSAFPLTPWYELCCHQWPSSTQVPELEISVMFKNGTLVEAASMVKGMTLQHLFPAMHFLRCANDCWLKVRIACLHLIPPRHILFLFSNYGSGFALILATVFP